MELRDLSPKKDPKGGSPRTPSGGIPLRTVQEYVANGNGTIWKMATSILAGLVIGLVVAYFTALQGKGSTQKDVQEYVEKFSPYSHDKEVIALQQQNQDKEIGILHGFKDRIFDRLNKIEEKQFGYDRDIADHDKKIKTIADYMEAEKTPKR